MKKTSLLFIAICFISVLQAQQPVPLIDLQHYEFSIALTDTSDVIKGKAAIDVLCIKDAQAITFDLISKSPFFIRF